LSNAIATIKPSFPIYPPFVLLDEEEEEEEAREGGSYNRPQENLF